MLGGLTLLGVAVGFEPALLMIWGIGCGMVAAAAGVDLWRLHGRRLPEFERSVPDSLPAGVGTEVTVAVANPNESPLTIELFDKPPPSFDLRGLPVDIELSPEGRTEWTYEVTPSERGEFRIRPADARLSGPFGLLRRAVEIGGETPVRVLPNYRAVSRYALLALADRTGELGVSRRRRRGDGTEFDHLREYREGDRTRQIDWKATARVRELISREYEEEHNQHLVFLLDCGRRMRADDDGVSHFDRALNASLLLTHVALDQGDSVALATFGGRDVWVPRQRGDRGMDVVLDHIYDLQPTRQPSDLTEGMRRLARRQRRRSTVVVLTNLYQRADKEMLRAVAGLRERHLVLIASLREQSLHAPLERPIERFDAALEVAATHEYLAERRATHRDLEARGVHLLDVPPDRLSVRLVNHYLEMMRG